MRSFPYPFFTIDFVASISGLLARSRLLENTLDPCVGFNLLDNQVLMIYERHIINQALAHHFGQSDAGYEA